MEDLDTMNLTHWLESHWERVVIGGNHVYIGGQLLDYDYTFPSVHAAVNFTKERLEELRQLDAEIGVQMEILGLLEAGAIATQTTQAIVNCIRVRRTIRRLTDASDALMRGMK